MPGIHGVSMTLRVSGPICLLSEGTQLWDATPGPKCMPTGLPSRSIRSQDPGTNILTLTSGSIIHAGLLHLPSSTRAHRRWS